jgi:hypothetical protein
LRLAFRAVFHGGAAAFGLSERLQLAIGDMARALRIAGGGRVDLLEPAREPVGLMQRRAVAGLLRDA